MNSSNALSYLASRMKEASSFGGIAVTVLGILHVSASPDLVNAVLGVVVAIGGVLAILRPESAAK